jgi:hypothetical protein
MQDLKWYDETGRGKLKDKKERIDELEEFIERMQSLGVGRKEFGFGRSGLWLCIDWALNPKSGDVGQNVRGSNWGSCPNPVKSDWLDDRVD